jgi:hypothetical protein
MLWSKSINSDSFALIDFCSSLEWNAYFHNSLVKVLPLFQSNHTPLVLISQAFQFNTYMPIKFEKHWLQKKGFKELFTIWWNAYIIISDFGENWRLKLHSIRKKIRRWSINLKSEQKKKLLYQSEIQNYN